MMAVSAIPSVPDRRPNDVIEPGIGLQQVNVAALEDGILLAAADTTRALAVPAVERIGDIDAFTNLAERHELLVVRCPVVAQVDEGLGRASVRVLEGVGDRATDVWLSQG